MKTYMANAANVQKNWVVVDVDGMTFGRAASQIAAILMGKNKPEYTPNVDTGDYVIALNVAKLTFTGKKLDQKYYYHHSGYPGGLKEVSYRHMMERKPEFLFKEAVRRMLPKNKLGDKMLTKLHVYAGAEHNHQAQCPVKVEL